MPTVVKSGTEVAARFFLELAQDSERKLYRARRRARRYKRLYEGKCRELEELKKEGL